MSFAFFAANLPNPIDLPMTVQIIALSAAIAYALSFVLSKRGFKNSTPITITFVSLLIQSVTLLTVGLTVTGIPSVTPFVFLLFAIAGILQAVVRMLTYIGIEKIGAARSGPIRASVPIWSAAIAIFFLGETITAAIGLGTILVVGGILLISWRADEHVKDFRPWFIMAHYWRRSSAEWSTPSAAMPCGSATSQFFSAPWSAVSAYSARPRI